MTEMNHDKLNRQRSVRGAQTRKTATMTKAEQRNAAALALAQRHRHRHPVLRQMFRRSLIGGATFSPTECKYIEQTVKQLDAAAE